MISPDDYMDRSVDQLVYWAAKLVARAYCLANLTDAEMDAARELMPELIDNFEEKEEAMRQANRAALILRADEVSAYLNSLKIDATAEMVRESPFAICAAAGEHLGWIDFIESAD